MPSAPVHTLILSPHLDDGAFSCGGLLAACQTAGKETLVVNVMAGEPPSGPLSPYAQSLHDRWQFDRDAVLQRRVEDRRAYALLGAAVVYFDIPDCIYRRDARSGATLYNSDADLFAGIAPAEKEPLSDAITSRLRELPSAERVVAPLGLGQHVDHQLVRLAAERRWGERLWYFEDYPYARDAAALAAVIRAPTGWEAEPIHLTEEQLSRKVAASLAYRSQIGTFFVDAADMRAQIEAYARQVGGERLWRLKIPY